MSAVGLISDVGARVCIVKGQIVVFFGNAIGPRIVCKVECFHMVTRLLFPFVVRWPNGSNRQL